MWWGFCIQRFSDSKRGPGGLPAWPVVGNALYDDGNTCRDDLKYRRILRPFPMYLS